MSVQSVAHVKVYVYDVMFGFVGAFLCLGAYIYDCEC